jgi:hypothetical protein
MNALRWMLAMLLLIFAFILGGLGVFWALGASQGAEWDYCGGSGGCTSGESIGFALLIPAGMAAFLGWRLVPRKRRS